MSRIRAEQTKEVARREELAREFLLDEPFHDEGFRDDQFNLVPPSVLPKKKNNTMEIPNVILASMRHNTGLRETAALIDAGFITQDDISKLIDHNKVKSVCQEPGGKYLFHFVPGEANKTQKPTELIAEQIVNRLVGSKKCGPYSPGNRWRLYKCQN